MERLYIEKVAAHQMRPAEHDPFKGPLLPPQSGMESIADMYIESRLSLASDKILWRVPL